MDHSVQALNIQGWETLGILLLVLILLISNKVRIDLVAIFILFILGVTGIVEEKQLFAGFGSEAIIVIASMLAIGKGLVRSGVTDELSAWITRIAGNTERRLLLILMTAGGLLSSFISDLAVVSIFLPVLMGFEKRLKIRTSRLLLPFALVSILGGLITMVGSATNIVANQIVAQSGLSRISLFEIAPLGLVLMSAGILFIFMFGRFLLPESATRAQSNKNTVGIHEYMTELLISENSSWIHKPLKEISFLKNYGLNVARILRTSPVNFPRADTVIEEGDVLLIQAHQDDLLKLRSTSDFSVQSQVQKSLEEANIAVAVEAIVRRGSLFVGKTLEQLHFRQRYDVTVLALWRNGEAITQRLSSIVLKPGDMLLLQGPREKMDEIGDDQGLLMISQKPHVPQTRHKGLLAIGILVLIFSLAALNVFSFALAGILGVALMVITRILSLNQIYRSIEWPILLFVAAMFALGSAMKETGITNFMSTEIVQVFGQWGPYALLAVCFCTAAITTQMLSNTATTLLLTPVMISVAKSLQMNPIPFVVTVIVGVTASPISYVSHKVFLIIMGPGGYRYFDYVRFGLPLTILFFLITMGLVPVIWPFH